MVPLAAAVAAAGVASGELLNFTPYTNAEGLPQHQVLALAQDARGYIWIGTYGGLTRYDGHTFVTLTVKDGLSANGVRDIVPAGDGVLWVGTLGGGVCRVVGGRAERCLRQADGLAGDYVNDLEPAEGGGCWVATDGGVSRIRADGTAETPVGAGWPRARVWAIKRMGERLIACMPDGVAEVAADGLHPLPVPGLHGHVVRAAASFGGALIVGAEDGLFRVVDGRLERVAVPGLPGGGPFVTDMAAAGDGLWVATRSGVLRLAADGSVRRLTTANGLLSDIVHRVLVDREGDLWFGTDDGASKLVPGPISVWTRRDGLPHPFVRAIAVDRRGRMWFGTRDG
ncbi:MAG: hypothetical protein D6739_07055, partial [Nitrospirae bacterium]